MTYDSGESRRSKCQQLLWLLMATTRCHGAPMRAARTDPQHYNKRKRTCNSRHSAAFIISSFPSTRDNKRSRSPLLVGSNTQAKDTSSSVGTSSNSRSRHWVKDELWKQDDILGFESPTAEKEDNEEAISAPTATTLHRKKDGTVLAVEVSSAITKHQVAQVRMLSKEIQNHGSNNKLLEEHFENRSFGEDKGGNDCTYLAPFLQALCPNVAERVKEIATLAYKAASWQDESLSPPMSLGIRTSEHLSYKGWRSLEAHKDVGSTFTIMISIKDPTLYEGGEFFLQNSMLDSTNIKLDQYSAICFKSDTVHGVRPIISGDRESFVTELWGNDDSPVGLCRPTEEQWEAFLDSQATSTTG